MKRDIIVKPVLKGRLSINETLGGPIIPPIERMRSLSEDEFEDLVVEWAVGYLKNKYTSVMRLGNSGDKGRDVICQQDDGTKDIYQCKHYSNTLGPASMWVELGKLCYYTFNKDYDVPKNYIIVTSRGIGQKLNDLIDKPQTINQELINQWADKCENKIISSKISLTGEFLKYVKNFDFSIISVKPPINLIEEHKQTTYYATRFGGGLVKYRNIIAKPKKDIQKRELVYTNQLLDIFSEKCGQKVADMKALSLIAPKLKKKFDKEREAFYCAESLDRFSRDNFADREITPFEELKEESLIVVSTSLGLCHHNEGYLRLENSKLEMIRQQFSSSPLHKEILNNDKIGMCHYLANENSITWMS